MAGKVTELTKNTVLLIMELHRNGKHKLEIADECGISGGFASQIIRAYHGNLKQLSYLAKEHQLLIKELSPFYNRSAINLVTEYECAIFFGLIKLKIKPKY